MGIAPAVRLLRAFVQEFAQRSQILRPAVRVRGGDDHVRHGDAGELTRLCPRQVREFARHGTKIIADKSERRRALLNDHRLADEGIVNAGAINSV